MTQFDITIVSDTSCPWCYIGYRRLQKAISLFQKTYPGGSKDDFNITWKPFYLKAGLELEESVVMNGSDELIRCLNVLNNIDRPVGSAEGITFNWKGKTGKTKQSHQLLKMARTKRPQLQCKVADELFRLHFEGERDITDVQTLVDAGECAGLNRNEILSWLENGNAGDLVDREAQEARDNGISSVPQFFLQAGKYPLDGAQDAMDFFEIFMRVKEEENN